eukprot:scaffold4995_cov385-Prasinococcus_capsulatus_cf.AAC.3
MHRKAPTRPSGCMARSSNHGHQSSSSSLTVSFVGIDETGLTPVPRACSASSTLSTSLVDRLFPPYGWRPTRVCSTSPR